MAGRMVTRAVLVAGLRGAAFAACAQTPARGPAGPEGGAARRQEWRVPSPDASTVSHALLFRPQGDGPFPDAIIAACGSLGKGARVPVTWVVAENDSYFSPALSRQMANAFRVEGDRVAFKVLPPFAREGHFLAEEG